MPAMDQDGTVSAADETSSAIPIPAPIPARRGKGRLILTSFLLLAGFLIGAAVTAYALPFVLSLWHGTPRVETVAAPAAGLKPLRAASKDDEIIDMRIADLEERLSRITIEAQAASGNAARAEGLLVAFAARRALDSGTPLGYIEGQLRLRFGQAQPRAVATIINASREPVTLVDLESELADIGPRLTGMPSDADWWTTFKREARSLFVIRRRSTPSPLPDVAYRRAQRLVESGRVDSAMTEVDRLPGRSAASRWMEMARRYREARRALDLVETAAILEPRQMRGSTGDTVAQPSPLAP